MANKQETIEEVALRLYPIDMQELTPWSDADMREAFNEQSGEAHVDYFEQWLSDYKQNLTK